MTPIECNRLAAAPAPPSSCPSERGPHPTHSEPTRSSLHVSRSVSPPIERSRPTISSPRTTTGKVQPACIVSRRAPALRSVAGSSSFHARLADELLLACATSWGAPPPRVVAGQVLPVCVTVRRAPPLACTWTELLCLARWDDLAARRHQGRRAPPPHAAADQRAPSLSDTAGELLPVYMWCIEPTMTA